MSESSCCGQSCRSFCHLDLGNVEQVRAVSKLAKGRDDLRIESAATLGHVSRVIAPPICASARVATEGTPRGAVQGIVFVAGAADARATSSVRSVMSARILGLSREALSGAHSDGWRECRTSPVYSCCRLDDFKSHRTVIFSQSWRV